MNATYSNYLLTLKILKDDLPDTDLTASAKSSLKNILHDYTSFSVSTIDSFFQKILRALTRELNLPLNMDIQVEMDDVILNVTELLLSDIGVNKDLTEWLTKLAIQKIDDEKNWNLEKDISSVALEIFTNGTKSIQLPYNNSQGGFG